ncbi:VWA domain-containing protein [Vibrio splendidus]|nr:VWA domain-containing protein [Vibrio splendidus]MCC4882876.1 VWA domain-containing protein [Vibrio splendidus]
MSNTIEQRIATIDLRKPEIIDLVKKTAISLAKNGVNLDTDSARVALCLDYSGSMYNLMGNGTVTEMTKRSLAQAIAMDDDGDIEVFAFGSSARKLNSVDVNSYESFCNDIQNNKPSLGGTRYDLAIKEVVRYYDSVGYDKPVFVIFITDGDTENKSAVEAEMKAASDKPIFWQFVGIGADDYDPSVATKSIKKPGFFGRLLGNEEKVVANTHFEFLVKLDELEGRAVDNAGFFAVSKPKEMAPERMFDLMNNEYPTWLKEVRAKGILK